MEHHEVIDVLFHLENRTRQKTETKQINKLGQSAGMSIRKVVKF